MDSILATLARAGIEPSTERVDTRPALLAALEREEWELVIYDPAARENVPLDLVYTYAPASAVVVVGDPDDMADELARLVAARADVIA